MSRSISQDVAEEGERLKPAEFQEHLRTVLEQVKADGLWRKLRTINSPQGKTIRIEGKTVHNFSSNDYLGLANEPEVMDAAIQAIKTFGAGCGASRLISGSLAPHGTLEELMAAFKGCEACLAFSSGYAAAQAAICSLIGKEDIIIIDKLVHASIIDAARLSGAQIRVYAHNHLDDLKSKLTWARGSRNSSGVSTRHALVVTESIFSMEGDAAPLPEIIRLKEKYGAWLMLDEAHATGLYGAHRRGLLEHFGLGDRVEIQMGTLGKALGSAGGYICGSRALIDLLINRARPFIFSTAPVPAAIGAATAALRFIESNRGSVRVKALWDNVQRFEAVLGRPSRVIPSAIIPLVLGDSGAALEAAKSLLRQGVFVPAIRFPSVPRDQARLRITLSAAHAAADIDFLANALQPILPTLK
jgi:8-amino-7-oxononanoate synthase